MIQSNWTKYGSKQWGLYILYLWLFLLGMPVWACGPTYRCWSAEDYYLCRLVGDNMQGEYSSVPLSVQYNANGEEWAKLTSRNIPIPAIKEVVYKWSLQRMDSLRSQGITGGNAFATWLWQHRDNEVMDFLILAKQSEKIRTRCNSKWYYSVEGDEESQQRDSLLHTLRDYQGTRLKDRYLLQEIRILFNQQQYQACVDLWEQQKRHFRKGVIRTMAANYINGACEHLGILHCALLPEIREQEELAKLSLLQSRIHQAEGSHTNHYEMSNLYKEVTEQLSKEDLLHKANWYYAWAFLADQVERPEEALAAISEAKKYATDTETKDAIRVLALFLRVKYAAVYDAELEQVLFRELVWLDRKIDQCLTPDIKERIAEYGIGNHLNGFSQYYWSDMLRKIVIGYVVPLCFRSNYQTRALQYLNYADYNLFKKMGQVELPVFDCTSVYGGRMLMDWSAYQLSAEYLNLYDYANDYFINVDSIKLDYVKRLAYRMGNPISPLDSFLNRNSYTDPDYLNELIGTRLIATGKYKEAVGYLRKVSERFFASRNVAKYYNRDPFSLKRKQLEPAPFYKLRFAEEMCRLEQAMYQAADPNDRAERMLRYACGILNSIDYCWALTCYYRGWWYNMPDNARLGIERKQIQSAANRYKRMAFSLFTDDERAAQACQTWYRWKTAATRYPHTKTAGEIRGHCDELVDY